MTRNFLVPRWMPAFRLEDLPNSRCMNAGCKREYIYCDVCGGKMFRTKHVGMGAEAIFNRVALDDAPHVGAYTTYRHICDKGEASR